MCTSFLIAPFLRDVVLNRGYKECYLKRQPMFCSFYVRYCRERRCWFSLAVYCLAISRGEHSGNAVTGPIRATVIFQ
jgi:hypothetical protein